MKKFLSFLLAVVMVCTMSACGEKQQTEPTAGDSTSIVSPPVESVSSPQPAEADTLSEQSNIFNCLFFSMG